jgi:DNA-binding NtrC family response regulator
MHVLFTVEPGCSIAEVEARLVRETLARVTSNRRKAAEILEISPRALAYKIKSLPIDTAAKHQGHESGLPKDAGDRALGGVT